MSLLEIQGLVASVEGKTILKGINLTVDRGEVHAIMGPNGSGKSTLSNVLAGREGYRIDAGKIAFKGVPIQDLSIEERSRAGLFLGFQYPIEIPGVTNMEFLKVALDSHRAAEGQPTIATREFMQLVREKCQALGFDTEFLKRYVNVGFSGGEKKRNEILQLMVLNPTLAFLDESDSGLDVDALQVVAKGINAFHHSDNALVLVTHYQRLLHYVKPDFVHVLMDGEIVKQGGASLALEIEADGYAALEAA